MVWVKGENGRPNEKKSVKIPNNSTDTNMKKAWCKLKSFYSDGPGKGYTVQGGGSVPDVSGWAHTVGDACNQITWKTKNNN